MKAILSGQAGVGIVVDGESISVVRVGHADAEPCRYEDVLWLLADASDISEIEVTGVDRAVDQLKRGWLSDRALQQALILLDQSEVPDIRSRAAMLLNSSVNQPGIADFVLNCLYSLRHIEAADFDGALRQTDETSGTTRRLLVELQRNRESIRVSREEWDALSAQLFEGNLEGLERGLSGRFRSRKRALERAMTLAGGFRWFARALSNGMRPDDDAEFLQSLNRKELADYADILGAVIEIWATAAEPAGRATVTIQVLGRPALLKLRDCARTLVNSLGGKALERGTTELLREAVEVWGRQGAPSEGDLGEGLADAVRHVAHRWLSESPGGQENQPLLNIWDAVNSLPPVDLHRLLGFARFRIGELGRKALGRDAEDLLAEAITATASGQRTWREGIDIRQHLYGAIRSISNSWYEKKGEEYLETDLVKPGDLSPLDQVSTALDPERILQAKQRLEQIRNLFAKDSEALSVVELLGEEWKPKEIQERLGIGAKKFDAVAKRIRRKLAAQGQI